MNENEWSDLQRLWKSAPPPPQPVVEELARVRRRRRWQAAEVVVGSVSALAGLGVAIALILEGGLFLIAAGIATCIFVIAVTALSFWAWVAPQPRADAAVAEAVTAAQQSARTAVRHAASMIWSTVAGMLFTAAMALARGLFTDEAPLAGYVAIGAVQLILAAWLAFAFRYYQARSAALARLDAIAAALEQ